ncbi:tRNA (N6-threonylcarbamoyladenosine(37)-N6)-methyltransferase TrmO [bacterium]|nr:tRNA (N6-threonylcarbamoyladenosine(37)-N6)-methyltransferase TrmO [bacterium]
MLAEEIVIEPIGIVHSDLKYRYETPRQGILAGGNISVIELKPNNNFEQALQDLDGFERIWILYQFHLNNNWKPLVNPPRHTRKKVGVFASRAPYRPNQIGMSCVRLEKIDGLKIFISESDILDGSPVIDIKPYLPYSDSFPDAATGWVKNDIENIFKVCFEQEAIKQCKWLKETSKINLTDFARLQLEFNPTDCTRKRITGVDGKNSSGETYVLAYRTWRIFYSVNEADRTATISEIQSGYTKEDLLDLTEDKYADKDLHLRFGKKFHEREK